MNRYDVRAWSGFALFIIAIALANILAGAVGVCVVVILTLGILYWADRHGHIKKDEVKGSHHDDGSDGTDDSGNDD